VSGVNKGENIGVNKGENMRKTVFIPLDAIEKRGEIKRGRESFLRW
jgi:hypothetical protein